jgi:hypothetical protein
MIRSTLSFFAFSCRRRWLLPGSGSVMSRVRVFDFYGPAAMMVSWVGQD